MGYIKRLRKEGNHSVKSISRKLEIPVLLYWYLENHEKYISQNMVEELLIIFNKSYKKY